jgi:sensor histidine kinase YesM
MKKNNVAVSRRGLKRDAKNKARKKRNQAQYNFHDLVNRVKVMQQYINQQTTEKAEENNGESNSNPNG